MLVKNGIFKHTSYKETKVFLFFFFFFFFSLFPTSLMFNSCPTRKQTTRYRFHSYKAVIGYRYLQTIPVSHVVDSSVTVRRNILANVPVYNLGLVAE